jgi:hypothetical protein
MSGEQLLQLHWPRPSQRRHGESRLRGLFHAGWLDRLPFQDGFARPRALYVLGRLGRSHVARKLGRPISDICLRPAKERRHDLLFLKHHLLTVQTVINLDLSARAADGRLLEYQDERALKAYRARTGAIPVVPDAYVALQVRGRVQTFCIELDRATVDLRSWRTRIRSYLQWTGMPSFDQAFRKPAVLIVVDAEETAAVRRLSVLKRLIEATADESSSDPSLFLLTSLAEAQQDAILAEPVWFVAGQPARYPLMT